MEDSKEVINNRDDEIIRQRRKHFINFYKAFFLANKGNVGLVFSDDETKSITIKFNRGEEENNKFKNLLDVAIERAAEKYTGLTSKEQEELNRNSGKIREQYVSWNQRLIKTGFEDKEGLKLTLPMANALIKSLNEVNKVKLAFLNFGRL